MGNMYCINRMNIYSEIKRKLENGNDYFNFPIIIYHGPLDEKWEQHFLPKFELVQINAMHFWKEYNS